MDRPEGTPTAVLEDSHNRMEILVFETHGQFAVYWQAAQDSEDRDDFRWKRGPRHYQSVMGAIRAAYVIELQQH